MRLAVDTDLLGRDGSGNETYLRGMLGGLQEVPDPALGLVLLGGEPRAVAAVAGPGAVRLDTRTGPSHDLLLGLRMRRLRADASFTHYNAPLGYGGVIATVVHDLSFLRVPETYPPLLRRRITLSVSRSVRRSDLIVTSSCFSRDELLSTYTRLRGEDVVVTYSAPDAEFSVPWPADRLTALRSLLDLPPVFVFSVGNLQPRKNLARLARASSSLNVPLVIAGRPTWRGRSVVSEVATTGARWLGYVSKEHLAGLYQLATVFAYPSLYEGFGLPVVEAMAAGTPVVTSDTSSLPEVAAGAATLVEPRSEDSIRAGLAELLDDPAKRRARSELGLARAAEFSWRRSADVLVDALRQRLPAT